MSRILKNYKNKITSLFGYRILNGKGQGHGGIDIVGTTRTNSLLDYITAHSDGEVIKVTKNIIGFVSGGSYGNYVIIKHDKKYLTLYAHMSYNSIKVRVGDKVKQGDIIGYMGQTGTSYGGHLHFEVRENGVRIDPKPYIDSNLPSEEIEVEIKKIKILNKPNNYEFEVDGFIINGVTYTATRKTLETYGYKVGWENNKVTTEGK